MKEINDNSALLIMQTIASQFIKEDNFNNSKGNLGIELFEDTLRKYQGFRTKSILWTYHFKDKSKCRWESLEEQWIEQLEEIK